MYICTSSVRVTYNLTPGRYSLGIITRHPLLYSMFWQPGGLANPMPVFLLQVFEFLFGTYVQ